MKTREMLDALVALYPVTEANIRKCKAAAFDALHEGDGGERVAAMHDLFREAEIAFVKAHGIMIGLEQAERERREGAP